MDTNLLGLCIEMLTKIPNNFIKAEHKTVKNKKSWQNENFIFLRIFSSNTN